MRAGARSLRQGLLGQVRWWTLRPNRFANFRPQGQAQVGLLAAGAAAVLLAAPAPACAARPPMTGRLVA
jgi:hypothetical protein